MLHFYFSSCCLPGSRAACVPNYPQCTSIILPSSLFLARFQSPSCDGTKNFNGIFRIPGLTFLHPPRVRRVFAHTESAALWLVFLNYEHANLDPVIICFNVMVLYLIFARGLYLAQISVSEIQFGKTPIIKIYIQHDSTLSVCSLFCPSDEAFDNWLSNYAGMTLKWCINICWVANNLFFGYMLSPCERL